MAYRDGKGGITLGLTTFKHTRHWDLVLVNPLYKTDVQNLINSCIGLNIWYELIDIVEEIGES